MPDAVADRASVTWVSLDASNGIFSEDPLTHQVFNSGLSIDRSHLRLGFNLPTYHEIKPFDGFLAGHPYEDKLRRSHISPGPKDFKDLLELTGKNLLKIVGEALPASPEKTHPDPRKDYHTHEWARDWAYSAFLLKWIEKNNNDGKPDKKKVEKFPLVKRTTHGLTRFYAGRSQRDSFHEFHYPESDPHGRYNEPWRRPPRLPAIRQPIDYEKGCPVEETRRENGYYDKAAEWANDQPGSFGQYLWTMFRMANQGVIDLKELNAQISRELAHEWQGTENANEKEAIFAVMLRFLHKICIREDSDTHKRDFHLFTTGPWEEMPAENRLSEIAPIHAAVREFFKLVDLRGVDAFQIMEGTQDQFFTDMAELLELSRIALNKRIPDNPFGYAVETDTPGVPQYDAAVITALYPYELELSRNQEQAILRTLYNKVMGEQEGGLSAPGIRRYAGDRYCGQNLHRESDGNWNVPEPRHGAPYVDPQWFIFDGHLMAYFFRKSQQIFESHGDPSEAYLNYLYGVSHWRRSYSQLPLKDEQLSIYYHTEEEEGEFPYTVKAYQHREAVYWNSDESSWDYNPNPLQWTASMRTIGGIRGLLASRYARRHLASLPDWEG